MEITFTLEELRVLARLAVASPAGLSALTPRQHAEFLDAAGNSRSAAWLADLVRAFLIRPAQATYRDSRVPPPPQD